MGTRGSAVLATLALALAAPATALGFAYDGGASGGGKSADAPGQETAMDKCGDAFDRQSDAGLMAGGGPKAGELGPLNCDHFFQHQGDIGGGPGS
jgi:hypothetical protein